MKTRLLSAFLVFSVVGLPFTFVAQAQIRNDGNWWLRLDASSRAFYVDGLMHGIFLGSEFSLWGLDKSDSEQSRCADDAVTTYQNFTLKYLRNVTVSQLVAGLNDFYKDYRNQKIKTDGAVWLVVNGIAGTPQAQIDKMTEKWRQNADK